MGLPRPIGVLGELVVADPLYGPAAGKGDDLNPDLQILNRTLAGRRFPAPEVRPVHPRSLPATA